MGPIVALFNFTVRQTLLSRKIWLTLLILVSPSALLILIRSFDTGTATPRDLWEMYHVSAHIFLMSVLVPLVCIVHGTALIAADTEARTITYLITRRMRRATVLLVRFTATTAVLAMLCDLAMITVHYCAVVGRDVPSLAAGTSYADWSPLSDLGCYLVILPLTVLAFMAIFTLIGLLTARPLAASVVYLIGVELILSNLPLRARIYSLTHQLKVTLAGLMPRVTDLYELPRNLAQELYPHGGTALPQLLGIIVIAMVTAAMLMTVRELMPTRVSRE